MSKERKLTKQQQQYRDSLFKNRKTPVMYGVRIREQKKEEEKPAIQIPETEITYMKNCIYWIEEFEKGNVKKERFNRAINSLRLHINSLIIKHQNKPTI